jgi:hypothetical protein
MVYLQHWERKVSREEWRQVLIDRCLILPPLVEMLIEWVDSWIPLPREVKEAFDRTRANTPPDRYPMSGLPPRYRQSKLASLPPPPPPPLPRRKRWYESLSSRLKRRALLA